MIGTFCLFGRPLQIFQKRGVAGVQGIDVGYHSFVYYHVRFLLFCKRALFRGRLSFGVDARQNFQHFIDGLCGIQHVGAVLDAAVIAGQAVLDFENQNAFVDQSVVFQEFTEFFCLPCRNAPVR